VWGAGKRGRRTRALRPREGVNVHYAGSRTGYLSKGGARPAPKLEPPGRPHGPLRNQVVGHLRLSKVPWKNFFCGSWDDPTETERKTQEKIGREQTLCLTTNWSRRQKSEKKRKTGPKGATTPPKSGKEPVRRSRARGGTRRVGRRAERGRGKVLAAPFQGGTHHKKKG